MKRLIIPKRTFLGQGNASNEVPLDVFDIWETVSEGSTVVAHPTEFRVHQVAYATLRNTDSVDPCHQIWLL